LIFGFGYEKNITGAKDDEETRSVEKREFHEVLGRVNDDLIVCLWDSLPGRRTAPRSGLSALPGGSRDPPSRCRGLPRNIRGLSPIHGVSEKWEIRGM
jgi:hypothetical protein